MSKNILSQPCENNKFTHFDLTTGHARIRVQSEADYWHQYDSQHSTDITQAGGLVRLTDDSDAHILLSPTEALSVAAAIQAIAVGLLERSPREIRRSTEPGQPAAEDLMGVGL